MQEGLARVAHVPVTYWTTTSLEPDIEAVSKEVFDLSSRFATSRIFSVSPRLKVSMRAAGRVLGFHPGFDPVLRVLIPVLERLTAINHVYAEISPWIYTRTLSARPNLLTIASEKGVIVPEFLARCAFVCVQTQRMLEQVLELGVPKEKCRLIFPGVDLAKFKPSTPRPGRTQAKILFATFPRTAEELETRGVWFLLAAAAAHPHLEFTLVSRPWKGGSTALTAVSKEVDRRALKNVRILEGLQGRMEDLYREADFTVIPYQAPDGGKECPLSLVESLACGVPVLISRKASFSAFVERNRCGSIFELDMEGFGAAVAAASAQRQALGESAATVARSHFDRDVSFRAYAELYDAILKGGAPAGSRTECRT